MDVVVKEEMQAPSVGLIQREPEGLARARAVLMALPPVVIVLYEPRDRIANHLLFFCVIEVHSVITPSGNASLLETKHVLGNDVLLNLVRTTIDCCCSAVHERTTGI